MSEDFGHRGDARFVESLVKLAPPDDPAAPGAARSRAALATLRRGLGKQSGEVIEMYPYVIPYVPRQAREWQEDAYFLIAGLFALHPLNWSPREDGRATNLGASFNVLRSKENASEGIERRFAALLDTPPETLPEHLRHAISLLRSQDVPVDYLQLLRDIQRWSAASRHVQRQWARAYWANQAASADEAPRDTVTEGDSD